MMAVFFRYDYRAIQKMFMWLIFSGVAIQLAGTILVKALLKQAAGPPPWLVTALQQMAGWIQSAPWAMAVGCLMTILIIYAILGFIAAKGLRRRDM